MLRRKFPTKKFIPTPPNRLCMLKPRTNFAAEISQIRSILLKILSDERAMAKKRRPKRWNGQPKPSTKSIFNRGYEDFEYVLKPHQRPSLAFGTKIPRDPNEKEIKRHKFKLRKKRGYGETYEREIKRPQLLRISRSREKSKSQDRSQSKALDESEDAFEEDSEEESEEPFVFDDDEEEEDEEFCDDDAYDDEGEEQQSEPISSEEEDSRLTAARFSSDNIENFKAKYFSSRTQKIFKDQFPSPASYTIRRFPNDNTCSYKAQCNRAHFNSTSAQEIKKITEVPSPAAYKVEGKIQGIKMNSSLGGKQTIVLPTVIRCTPRNRLLCKKCLKVPIGDFYYSKYHGTLCRECFPVETKSISPQVMETFKKARHCNFMHYHAQHNTIRHKKEKDIIRSVRREAYLDQFPELMKTPKIVKKIQSAPLTKGDFHKRMLKALKPFEKPKDCGKICKTVESEDKLSHKLKRERKSQEEPQKQRKESADWEFIMLAKEMAYGLAKGRSSIAPIYHLLNPEDKQDLFQLEYGKAETSDFQTKLFKRFGSPAPYYGTLIPEFREKGVVHDIDPESDKYTLTAKGREFYKKTPLAWELSQEMNEDENRIDEKTDLDEIIKKKITISTKQKQRDVKTPPLPGPRLSLIATNDTLKPPKPRSSKIYFEKPIISRDYDIPQSYWYNIEY